MKTTEAPNKIWNDIDSLSRRRWLGLVAIVIVAVVLTLLVAMSIGDPLVALVDG